MPETGSVAKTATMLYLKDTYHALCCWRQCCRFVRSRLETSGRDGIVRNDVLGVNDGNSKAASPRLIQNLLDDSTLEDIQYHLYVRGKVERGLTDLKRRRTVSQREAEERMQKWLKG
jgi:hypothetical protein